MPRIQTPLNEKFIDENGILNIIIREGAEFTLDNIKEDEKANYELTSGRKVLALVDASNNFTATDEASEYIRSNILKKTRIATAIVTGNLASRLIINFFMKMKPAESPVKLFGSREEALQWLLEQEN